MRRADRLFWLLIFIFCIHTAVLHGQNSSLNNKQLIVTSENDAFAQRGTDGYYTNGFFISYSVTGKKKKDGVRKSINNFQIGQKIFTQGARKVLVLREVDRPVTGYFFGRYDKSFFKENGSYFDFGASLSVIGKASLAKPILSVVHPYGGIKDYWNWIFDYQLNNEVGINAHGTFAFPLLKNREGKIFDVYLISNATLGTLLTNARQSLLFRVGRFNRLDESEMWGSRIGADKNLKKELFAFVEPSLTYQLYDATIQGGLFNSNTGRVVSKPNPTVLNLKFGGRAAFGRFSVAAYLNYLTKEARSQERNHAFGGVQFSYRF